jgi:hypothetical protein
MMINNPFAMVVCIVLISAIARVMMAKYGYEPRSRRRDRDRLVGAPDSANAAENAQLRDDVRTLKDRIIVLERLATDNHSAINLDREIEQLRDR